MVEAKVVSRATRDGFGDGITELGKINKNVFVLTGDLSESTRADKFQKLFPDRFFNMGISEQDMLGTAVGLALSGKIPFVCSFSCFIGCRAYDQIRISLCYNNQNVKIAATHSGLTTGADGATAQVLEDIAIMRVLPNMSVIVPCDSLEAKKATIAAASFPGPVFMKLGRQAFPVVTSEADLFQVGKANILREGKDLSIIACGVMVGEALKASKALTEEGIDAGVINMHTIKPLDKQSIINAARITGAVVTAEEHQVHGGLGSAVAEVLSKHEPAPVEMVAVEDTFGESGSPQELLERYGLTWKNIVYKAKVVLQRKHNCSKTY